MPIPKRVDQQLREFYENKLCAVRKWEIADWNHLDEHRPNYSFANLVPAGPTINQIFERTRRAPRGG